nr:hypothetical protein FFPRI1PSEUD_39890 [Pseudomonas sp. FFPRI_1]
MNFLIVRRRERGVAIPAERLSKTPLVKGDVHLVETHSQELGRSCIQAWIFKSHPGPDVFPRLLDAKINSIAQLGLNNSGLEEVDWGRCTRSRGGVELNEAGKDDRRDQNSGPRGGRSVNQFEGTVH